MNGAAVAAYNRRFPMTGEPSWDHYHPSFGFQVIDIKD
jgi:hypothetical protein